MQLFRVLHWHAAGLASDIHPDTGNSLHVMGAQPNSGSGIAKTSIGSPEKASQKSPVIADRAVQGKQGTVSAVQSIIGIRIFIPDPIFLAILFCI